MKTFLPQNQFHSTATSPPAVDSDGEPSASLPSGESDPSVMLDYAPSEEAVVRRAAASDNFEDDLERLIGVAGKRRRLKLPRFVPDYEGMEAAINDPGAPRLRADDPIWTDASPLFLQGST